MKTPPFLLGAALMFWGWQTGLLFLALPITLILEGSQFIQWRWDFSSQDIRNIAKSCLIFVFLITTYLLISNRSIQFVYTLLQWLPIIFSPLVFAQLYSISDRIDIRTLFLLLNSFSSPQTPERFYVNLTYPYFLLCLLSASAANIQDLSFYLGMFLMVAIALFPSRSQRFSPLIWMGSILLAGSLGFVGFMGLHRLHLAFEQAVIEQFSHLSFQDADPFQKSTAMGDIGELKLSNQIFFRVTPEKTELTPILLRESTYNKYQSSRWFASNSQFKPIQPASNLTSWQLIKQPSDYSQMTIVGRFKRGKGLLKLPQGTFQINQLPVSNLEKNQYGTIKFQGNPDLLSYQILFNSRVNVDSLPTDVDLQIPKSEKSALTQIVKELDLKGKPPEEVLKRVKSFFEANFSYSLQLLGTDRGQTSLSSFLLKHRSGHCEYFATATALLLREVGIPTRYAIGFSVSEFSALENQLIVRGRDGHAWTLVYINGAWQNFDTTPAGWSDLEDAAAPRWEFITDFGSFLGFQLTLFLKYIQTLNLLNYSWFLIPPVLLIIVQLKAKQRVYRSKSKKRLSNPLFSTQQRGTYSEFYLIEKSLNELGFFRHPSESLKYWIQRLKQEFPQNSLIDDLFPIVELHYRCRFDPQGMSQADQEQLNEMVQDWLKSYYQKK